MNEEALNLSLRKFLKTVGVTAQREIEKAVAAAAAAGRLSAHKLPAAARITVDGVGLDFTVNGMIDVE
jgi:hypothetical protein